MNMRLSDLQKGEKGIIVKVLGHGGFRKRVVEMGFIKGKEVEVLLSAPLKDPIKYKIMGYEISLRRSEAELIEIVPFDSDIQTLSKELPFHGVLDDKQESLQEYITELAWTKSKTIHIALAGNPNCGKTSLFNTATHSHEHVGNYSGVTVDSKSGEFDFEGYHFKMIDLPGTYSLSAYSPEELFVRKYILEQRPDIVLNIIDGSNIERNLYLTTQLIDINIPMVIALNMFDELEQSGNQLNIELLSQLLGIPIVPTIGNSRIGINKLLRTLIQVFENSDKTIQHIGPETAYFRHIHINHGPELEYNISRLKEIIRKNETIRYHFSTRFLAIKLLEKDTVIDPYIEKLNNANEIFALRDKSVKRIEETLEQNTQDAFSDAKFGFIKGAMQETFEDNHQPSHPFTKKIDFLVTHNIWGFPLFFLFMFIMFETTFVLGGYPMQWIENAVEYLSQSVDSWMNPGPIKDLIIDGILGGVGGVIVFLPNILILFTFISWMEDSGYMSRAAFIMDKVMHTMGLHGKSFIPLVMGFGCNVPAVLATRTIDNKKNRLITILVLPLISCSARLPVYLLFAGMFFPQHASLVLFGIYTIGILLAVLIARLLSKSILKGDDSPFVMELPPYRLPSAKSIIRHTWDKGVSYLKKMGGIIMIASIIIWFLGYYPHNPAALNGLEQQEQSFLGMIGKTIEPILTPIGFNWQLGIGLLSGAGAKELIVSTLSVLYPEQIPISPLSAFCFMLFVLIYFPCLATLAAVKEETKSWKWVFFTAIYTTTLAYILTLLVYQIGKLLWG